MRPRLKLRGRPPPPNPQTRPRSLYCAPSGDFHPVTRPATKPALARPDRALLHQHAPLPAFALEIPASPANPHLAPSRHQLRHQSRADVRIQPRIGRPPQTSPNHEIPAIRSHGIDVGCLGHRSKTIHVGAWSLASSSARTQRSTPASTRSSTRLVEMSRWSRRTPWSVPQRLRR